jgi:hypothetical protein
MSYILDYTFGLAAIYAASLLLLFLLHIRKHKYLWADCLANSPAEGSDNNNKNEQEPAGRDPQVMNERTNASLELTDENSTPMATTPRRGSHRLDCAYLVTHAVLLSLNIALINSTTFYGLAHQGDDSTFTNQVLVLLLTLSLFCSLFTLLWALNIFLTGSKFFGYLPAARINQTAPAGLATPPPPSEDEQRMRNEDWATHVVVYGFFSVAFMPYPAILFANSFDPDNALLHREWVMIMLVMLMYLVNASLGLAQCFCVRWLP